MGLLDAFEDPGMALAAGLLGGGTFGQALGRGVAGAQAMRTSQSENEIRKAEKDRLMMQIKEKIDAAKAAQANGERDGQFQQALQQGVPLPELAKYFPEKIDMLKKLSEAPNFGRQAVARTIDGKDENGQPVTYQIDQFGNKIGGGIGQWKAPVMVGQGDRTTAVDPTTIKNGQQFMMNLSPSERDASARGWASNGIAQQRLAMDKAENGNGQKPPAGYRWKPDGTMEAIPGGPADTKLGAPGAKMQDAKDVLSILDMAEPLLKKSTGSYLGAGVDAGARAFGISTTGAEAAAELKALQGALVSKMPKMAGPQSDKDVQLYREMAGQIGDPTIPVATRQAAMKTIRDLNEKYAGGTGGATGDFGAPKSNANLLPSLPTANASNRGKRARDTATGKTYVSNGMQWKEE